MQSPSEYHAPAYPIITTTTMGPPERRLLLGDRRDPASIPVAGPNEVLVICAGGAYHVESSRHFTGRESIIAHATAVAVVDLSQRRMIYVEVEVPSFRVSESFHLSVGFACSVTSPADVVRAGLRDLRSRLKNYLTSHHEVMTMGTAYVLEEIDQLRRDMGASLQSLQDLDPIMLPGMSADLTSWDVMTTSAHIEFDQQEVSARRRAQVTRVTDQERYRTSRNQIKYAQNIRDLGQDAEDDAFQSTLAEEYGAVEAARAVRGERQQRARELREERLIRSERQYEDEREDLRWRRARELDDIHWEREKEGWRIEQRNHVIDALQASGAFKLISQERFMAFLARELELPEVPDPIGLEVKGRQRSPRDADNEDSMDLRDDERVVDVSDRGSDDHTPSARGRRVSTDDAEDEIVDLIDDFDSFDRM